MSEVDIQTPRFDRLSRLRISRTQWDALAAVAAGIAAFGVSAFFNLEEKWHQFAGVYDGLLHLEELPVAFLVAGIGFAWFAWRRWHDFEQAAEDRQQVNERLSEQLERNEQMIAQLRDARHKAVELDRAKTRFLAHMSHELRTPLNAIIGFSELMQLESFGPLGDKHYADYTNSIHESGHHLLELINDLLDLTRIESGDLTPHDATLPLGDVADTACKMLSDQATTANVFLCHTRTPAALLDVRMDGRMIRQVLINLIANAIRHTPAEGSIEITAFEKPDGHVGFTIADTGEGMEQGTMRRAQQGFAEVENAFRREHNGAGIGLPLSRAIMRSHGGELSISSTLGEGTTIEIVLPAERVEHGYRAVDAWADAAVS